MKSCSMDLRNKIIKQWKRKSFTLKQLADNFGVSRSTVNRYIDMYKKTHSVSPEPHRGGNPPKIDYEGSAFIKKTLKKTPEITLSTLQELYAKKFKKTIHTTTFGRHITKLGYSRKKKQ